MISNNFVADRDRYNKIYIGNDIQWTTTRTLRKTGRFSVTGAIWGNPLYLLK